MSTDNVDAVRQAAIRYVFLSGETVLVNQLPWYRRIWRRPRCAGCGGEPLTGIATRKGRQFCMVCWGAEAEAYAILDRPNADA